MSCTRSKAQGGQSESDSQGQGQACGREQGRGANPECLPLETRVWLVGPCLALSLWSYRDMASHHLLTLEICDCQQKRVLESLSTCTNAILTVTWAKGISLSCPRSWFLQSYCVDNFTTSGASCGLECVTLRRWQEDWGQREMPWEANVSFSPGHRPAVTGLSDAPWSVSGSRRSEDVGILKAQFPGTITWIIMLYFIHLKDDIDKYSLGSEGLQTQWAIKCCIRIVGPCWKL